MNRKNILQVILGIALALAVCLPIFFALNKDSCKNNNGGNTSRTIRPGADDSAYKDDPFDDPNWG